MLLAEYPGVARDFYLGYFKFYLIFFKFAYPK